MTRGKLVVITNHGVYSSIEFNGDMYPEGCGEDAIRELIRVDNTGKFLDAVIRFNREHHNYEIEEEELIFNCGNNIVSLFDMSVDYFDKWFSDYLYVKNMTDKPVPWKDRNGTAHIMEPGSITVIYFGMQSECDISKYECRVTRQMPIQLKVMLNQLEVVSECGGIRTYYDKEGRDMADGGLDEYEYADSPLVHNLLSCCEEVAGALLEEDINHAEELIRLYAKDLVEG